MARKKPAKPTPAPVAAVKHKDARTNIPTREQGALVADAEAAPRTILYPRDPSLDPQLVWQGKDEQDRHPLEVPAVPVYIQEKIHPQALIEDLRARAAAGKPRELSLFDDFNGLENEPGKRTEFYQHDRHWTNRLILGDSLLVLTSLAEKERLKGRVQMIYLDPPYGIKFGSNWQVSTKKRDVKDSKAEDLTRQPEQVKAFRDTWQLGIHSYLTYLRDRLTVARELLTESGSIFVQIGDENVHLVRSLMDEVFGSENNCAIIVYAKTTTTTGELLPGTANLILWYAKYRDRVKYKQLYSDKIIGGGGASGYSHVEETSEIRRPMTAEEKEFPSTLPDGSRIYSLGDLTSPRVREARTGYYPIKLVGKEFLPLKGEWKTHKEGMMRLIWAKRVQVVGNTPRYVRFINDFPAYPLNNVWSDTGVAGYASQKVYIVETNTKVVQRCLLMTTDPGDLVLDPTCGSGTTAYVAEQWGRRWITTDTSRVALALARTRLMAARFPYYLLADSPEGRQKEAELTGVSPADSPAERDVRKGFVYKRVPHVTLKSIANNPDIREGMTRAQIDATIRQHADTETLYDQPYEDKGVVRVTGPFTVESLSPHRVLPAGAGGIVGDGQTVGGAHPTGTGDVQMVGGAHPTGTGDVQMVGGAHPTGSRRVGTAHQEPSVAGEGSRRVGTAHREPSAAGAHPPDFVPAILDNLRKAGVQNTKKGERLVFDRLDPYPGEYLQAEGTYDEAGTSRRVAVCVGPEFGTVGPELLASAALEAAKGVPFNLLLVCGFAFDPHVGENSLVIEKQFGRLRVLCVRMNPDLAMGDTLLKKTGAGNLFLVFGEPDVVIEKQQDGKLVVEVRGVDVFDPTTGEIRSSGPDDVACWFLDTDYNGESFFVRHAYFLGGQEPYEKLKRALRAEIDEAEWSRLYSARSVPFDPPKKGKIAIKVINHYGDEVLKVYGP